MIGYSLVRQVFCCIVSAPEPYEYVKIKERTVSSYESKIQDEIYSEIPTGSRQDNDDEDDVFDHQDIRPPAILPPPNHRPPTPPRQSEAASISEDLYCDANEVTEIAAATSSPSLKPDKPTIATKPPRLSSRSRSRSGSGEGEGDSPRYETARFSSTTISEEPTPKLPSVSSAQDQEHSPSKSSNSNSASNGPVQASTPPKNQTEGQNSTQRTSTDDQGTAKETKVEMRSSRGSAVEMRRSRGSTSKARSIRNPSVDQHPTSVPISENGEVPEEKTSDCNNYTQNKQNGEVQSEELKNALNKQFDDIPNLPFSSKSMDTSSLEALQSLLETLNGANRGKSKIPVNLKHEQLIEEEEEEEKEEYTTQM